MNQNRLEQILDGKKKNKSGDEVALDTIHIDVADKSAIRMGEHLMDIFPELYER